MKKRISIMLSLIFLLFTTSALAEIIPSDRKINWNPGIPGGIPYRTTIFRTLSPSGGDDTVAINNAISACPEGQVIYFSAGTYSISSVLEFSKGIVLRGDGPENTIIQLTNPSAKGVVCVAGSGSVSGMPQAPLIGSYAKGSATLTIDTNDPNEGLFTAGKYIFVGQSDGSNPDIVRGDVTWNKVRNEIDNDYASASQIVKIESRTGDTITISPSLYLPIESQYNPFVTRVAYPSTVVTNVGIEDMKLERTSDGGDNVGMGGFIVLFEKTVYSWIKNIETAKVAGQHIILKATFGCEVRESYWHEAWNYNSGGTAYGLGIQYHSSDNLVTDNIAMYLNSAGVIFEGAGGGNVISYNFFDGSWLYGNPAWQIKNIGSHGSHPFMNLVEGNYIAGYGADSLHGSTGHFTVFRNFLSTDHIYETQPNHSNDYGDDDEMTRGIRLDLGYYINVVGNVIGQPSYPHSPFATDERYECTSSSDCNSNASKRHMYVFRTDDPKVYNTTLRHGNFDYFNEDIVWDQNIPDQNLPDSYYLSSKPAFFECRAWPSVKPEEKSGGFNAMVGSLPAKDRFYGVDPCSGLPSTPTGFKSTN